MNTIPFLLVKNPSELRALLLSVKETGGDFTSPGWQRANNPRSMRGVRSGWETWKDAAPSGAVVMPSESEQRAACGDRWFLFPND